MCAIGLAIIIVTVGFYGTTMYHSVQRMMSTSENLCGGNHGIGEIASIGNDSFILKRNDGSNQLTKLTGQTTIKTSTGSGSILDLKTGDDVAIVGKPSPDGSEAATAVLVCSKISPKTRLGQ